MSFVNKPQSTSVAPTAVMELEDVNDGFALPPPVVSPSVGFNASFGDGFTQADDWLSLACACPTSSFDFSVPDLPQSNTLAGTQSTMPEQESYTPVGTQPTVLELPQEESFLRTSGEMEPLTLLRLEGRIKALERRLQAKEGELKYAQVEHWLDGVLGEVRSTRTDLAQLHDALQSLVHLLVDNQAAEQTTVGR